MEEPDRPPPTADKVDRALQPFNDLFTYSRRTRALVVGLIASVTWDVLITVAVAWYAYRAERTASQLTEILAARAVAACESRNDFKDLDLARWKLVVAFSEPDAGATPEEAKRERQQSAEFLRLIEEADKHEDCTAIVIEPR